MYIPAAYCAFIYFIRFIFYFFIFYFICVQKTIFLYLHFHPERGEGIIYSRVDTMLYEGIDFWKGRDGI